MAEPGDRDLDSYLKGGSRLSRAYREASAESAPPELDAAILAQARAAVRPRRARWRAPLALAATVMLGVGVGYQLYRVEPVPETTARVVAAAPMMESMALPPLAAPAPSPPRRESSRQAPLAPALRAGAEGMAAAAPQGPEAPRDPFESAARRASEARNMLPAGWHLLGHATNLYEAAVDSSVLRSAPDSLVMWRTGPGGERCGRLQTEAPAPDLAGRDVRLSAALRGQGVTGSVLLFVSYGADGRVHTPFQQAHVVPAETGWTDAHVDASIPPHAERVVYGALLCGPGTLWLDDVRLESR